MPPVGLSVGLAAGLHCRHTAVGFPLNDTGSTACRKAPVDAA